MPQDPALKKIIKRDAKPEHEAYVKWIKAQTGYDADLETVTVALRLHSAFRTSDAYQSVRTKEKEARQANLDAQHQRGIDAQQARLDKLKEASARIEARLAERGDDVTPQAKPKPKAKAAKPATKPATKPARGRKATKATKEVAPVEEPEATEDNVTEISQPRRGRRGRPVPATTDDGDEF